MLTTAGILTLARKHLTGTALMESSARLCMADALRLYEAGNFSFARQRALKSLAYTVGIAHRDYLAAKAAVENGDACDHGTCNETQDLSI